MSAAAVKAGNQERLARYRGAAFARQHPEVVILLTGPRPRAWAGAREIAGGSLRELLDELDERFPPDEGGG